MKNRKNFKILGGVVLTLVLVAILSITYATYTQTLNITGAGTLKKAKWEIKFKDENGESDVKVTTHSAETGYETDVKKGTVSVDDTTLSISDAELKRPGDYIEYEVEVENKGDFDAILSAANTTLTCKKALTDDDQTVDCKKHIKVSLFDGSNTELVNSDNGQSYNQKDEKHKLTHASGVTEKFKLRIEYKDDNVEDGSALPTEDIRITEFGATLNYVQYTTN